MAEHKSEVGVLWYYQLRLWFFLFIQQMLFQAHSHKCEISNVIVVSSQRSLSKYNFLFCMPFLWAHWIRCRLSKMCCGFSCHKLQFANVKRYVEVYLLLHLSSSTISQTEISDFKSCSTLTKYLRQRFLTHVARPSCGCIDYDSDCQQCLVALAISE